jgi:hypothetical protein
MRPINISHDACPPASKLIIELIINLLYVGDHRSIHALLHAILHANDNLPCLRVSEQHILYEGNVEYRQRRVVHLQEFSTRCEVNLANLKDLAVARKPRNTGPSSPRARNKSALSSARLL